MNGTSSPFTCAREKSGEAAAGYLPGCGGAEAGLIGPAPGVSEQSQGFGWGEPDTLEAEARVLGDQVVVAVVVQNTRAGLMPQAAIMASIGARR
jgi:hypothetical protein